MASELKCLLYSERGLVFLPGDSHVAPFWLWPAFTLEVTIYYPKRNYIGVSRHWGVSRQARSDELSQTN